MLLFGWPRRFKHVGPAYPSVCNGCEQDTYFHLVKSRRWFTIWFIPFLPLGTATWSLVCAHCEQTIVINDKGELQNAKRAAEITTDHTDYVMNSSEYWPEIDKLSKESKFFSEPEREVADPESIERESAGRSFQ